MPVACWLCTRSVTEGVNKITPREKEKSEAFEVGVDMPGACQLSGNVVPAVGMCEGAKPLRIQGFAITKHKIFIRFPKVNPIYFIFRPAIKMFQTGLCYNGFFEIAFAHFAFMYFLPYDDV
ncbi:hypothetical protein SAMN02745190_01750 [Schwartzia succinivorans DSM 10502]|jgi:hypothetical protein|uniref:Uncharacterized protein n=1 Tax=Schwartzia succinivorans DSM 10502 TaxID=1123243 RepID=A0A1M4YGY0_9FIRM|nr:hypothetical protein SAMN02745190_01750 [Schwartzia succinivorans DSM 10502]